MSERIEIKPYGANPRQLDHIMGLLVRGGLIAYPPDSGYAVGWRSNNRKARDRVIRLRGLDRHHHFTYCCRSLSERGMLTKVHNSDHRLMRQLTPGPYTFVLESTKNVSRTAQLDNRRTIGVRIPAHPVVPGFLEVTGRATFELIVDTAGSGRQNHGQRRPV